MNHRLQQGIASLMLCLGMSGCSTFYWNVPTLHEPPNKPANAGEDVSPEAMCALVRQGAYDHRDIDATLGIGLTVAGAIAAVAGTALAAKTGHSDEWVGEWAAVAGAGGIATAVGIYFITRAGEDRADYWLANGAVAQVRADYNATAYAVPVGKNALQAAVDAKKKATQSAAEQASKAALAVAADAKVTALQQYDLKANLGAPSKDTRKAMDEAAAAHTAANTAAEAAAGDANDATLALNYLLAQQTAWGTARRR